MKRNPFSKSTISFDEQRELSERVRTIMTESWDKIKASKVITPTSLFDDSIQNKSDSEPNKK